MKTLLTVILITFSSLLFAQPEPEPICGKTRFHHYLDSTMLSQDPNILDKAFYIWVNVSAKGEINCTYQLVRKEGYRYSPKSFDLLPEFNPKTTLEIINNVIKNGPKWQPASSNDLPVNGRKLILFAFNPKKLVFDWNKCAYVIKEP